MKARVRNRRLGPGRPVPWALAWAVLAGCAFGRVDEHLRAGAELQRQGMPQEAIAQFDRAIELDPEHTVAYISRCAAYNSIGRQKRALEDCHEAVRLDPQVAEAHYQRGRVYTDLRDYITAILDFDKAIEIDGSLADAYHQRGTAYMRIGGYETAVRDYHKAISLDPQLATAFHDRGSAYYALDKFQAAIDDYSRAIELEPLFASAYYDRAAAYERLAQYELSIQDYQRANKLDPGLVEDRGNNGLRQEGTTAVSMDADPYPYDALGATTYDRILTFLDRRVEGARGTRRDHWKRNFSNVDDYLESIEPYRREFVSLIRVPEECLIGSTPELRSDEYVTTIQGVEIRALELDVCDKQLLVKGPMAVPPQSQDQSPLVIAFHGTERSPATVFGLHGPGDVHHEFALRLVQQGYAVFAPQLITGGSTRNQLRNQLDNRATPVGERLVGIEIGQVISAIDYFVTREEVDAERVSTYGLSLGGLMSFYLGAVDQRIKVTVTSGYVEDRAEKLVALDYASAYWRHMDADWIFIPGQLLRFTDVDIASLIVPRKLFIEVGSEDDGAPGAQREFAQIEVFYTRLGVPSDYVGIGIGEGGHQVFLTDSLDFLNRWMHLVLALGRPGGTVLATLGIVSALGEAWRSPAGGRMDRYLQTDVVMYPGFSGGPLVDVKGHVIGLNTSALLRGISLTVPASTINRVVEELLTHGRIRRGYLGIGAQPVRLQKEAAQGAGQETGLLLVSVETGSPAEKGGLMLGDTIIAVNDHPTHQLDDLLGLLGTDKVGVSLPVRVVRGGKLQDLTVTVGERT